MNIRRGFTLIEILVAVGIVAVLTGVMTFAVENTRKSARDDRRVVDLKEIQAGLEEFYSHCRQYPSNSYYEAHVGLQLTGDSAMADEGWQTCIDSNVFMDELPDDPLAPTYRYRYNKIADDEYVVCAYQENSESPSANTGSCGGFCGSLSCNYLAESPR